MKNLNIIKAINKNAKFRITGIRPGEKLHEQMIGKDELTIYEFKDFLYYPCNF